MGQGSEMDGRTTGGLLGGRLIYRQLRTGHRTGFEPVLLAAAIQAAPGELVLEAGTGAGAALLCLAARIPGIRGIGVERDAALAHLANENFKMNGFDNIVALQGDVEALPFPPQTFHHVLANPPWFNAASTPSPDRRRALAHQASPDLLSRWIVSLTRVLRPKGSLTLILPAAALAAASALISPQYGAITLFPFWPRAGDPAKITLLAARKGAKAPARILPGLVLHDANGITEAAQRILRDQQAVLF